MIDDHKDNASLHVVIRWAGYVSNGGSKPNSRPSVIAFMDHFPARFRHSPTIIAKHSSGLRAPLLAFSLAVVRRTKDPNVGDLALCTLMLF